MSNPRLYLASNSPRRRALLDQIGVSYAVIALDLDEAPFPGEEAADYVIRVARDKARAGAELVAGDQEIAARESPRLPVLAADTAVVVDGQILGKPRDAGAAAAILHRLSGRTHQVMSGVALIGGEERSALSVSEVRFRAITADEVRTYWDTGEPADKAGGYAIQGLGALFVAGLSGSYSGVMGLPLFETARLLAAEGIDPLAPAANNGVIRGFSS